MSVSAQKDLTQIDPTQLYTRTYVKPLGKISRNIVKVTSVPASQTAIVNGSNKFIIQLPSSQRIVNSLRLKINASCTGSGGTYVRFRNNISCVMDQVALTIGGRQFYNSVRKHGLKRNVESNMNQDAVWVQTAGGALEGFGSQPQRNTWGAGRDYLIQLKLGGLFEIPFPTNLLGGTVVQLELIFAPANQCLETDHTSYSYSINSCQAVVDYLDESDQAYAKIRYMLDSQGQIAIPYQYETVEVANLPASQTSLQFNIQEKSQSVNKVVHVLQVQADESNPAVNDVNDTFPFSTAISYQYNYSGKPIPQQVVDCTNGAVEAYHELLHQFDNDLSSESRIAATGPRFAGIDFGPYGASDKFIWGYRFSSPLIETGRDQLDVPVMGTGLNTALGSSNMFVTLNKSAVATTYNVYTFVYSDALLLINKDGSVDWVK